MVLSYELVRPEMAEPRGWGLGGLGKHKAWITLEGDCYAIELDYQPRWRWSGMKNG